jgi:hypothetical protein
MNEKDNLIGLDEKSGGYPWEPTNLTDIYFWPSLEKAQGYCDIMNYGGSYGHFTPVEVKLVIL